MIHYIWIAVLIGGFMYCFASLVADKVADKVIKEISDLIEDKMS